ncbi:hypothetical protein ACE193_23260 [Bernardetia sp. OM2101]|uniref:hypothetical protein n=1 Tax=Bernardetia sp. OM2101 TaxID=3344876 RepID=UPI0035D01D58
MNNEEKVTPDSHLIYLTKLTPTQLAEQLRNNISDATKTETFREALKSGFYFTGTVSENSFHLKTKDKHEYKLKGKFFEEADYTKVEVIFEYDNFISKKWRKILLIITGVLFFGIGARIFFTQSNELWIVLGLLGLVFFALLFPNHREKLVISSYKEKLGKILGACEFMEK